MIKLELQTTECKGELIIDGEFTFCILKENHAGDCIDTFNSMNFRRDLAFEDIENIILSKCPK